MRSSCANQKDARSAVSAAARALCVACVLGVSFLASPGSVVAAGIEILLSEDSGPYREIAGLLRAELPGQVKVSVSAQEPRQASARGPGEPELVIAVGRRALTEAFAGERTSVIATLVPRAAYESALKSAHGVARRTSAVFIDQPYSRQFNLIELVLPGRTRAGVVLSSEFEESMKGLRAAAAAGNFSVVAETLDSEQGLYAALVRVLSKSDFLLAVPDSSVYSAHTIHNILLTTFRVRQPVFGFSPAYVRAGALAALYSTPAQLAAQTGEIARRVLAGEAMPGPQHPRAFKVGINATVARALGLGELDSSVLESRLAAMEQAR